MEYTPVEWHTGDVITEEKLNSMVSGITEGVSEVLLTTFSVTNPEPSVTVFTLNHTYKEIADAKFNVFTGSSISGTKYVTIPFEIGVINNVYTIKAIIEQSDFSFTANNENDYPTWTHRAS